MLSIKKNKIIKYFFMLIENKLNQDLFSILEGKLLQIALDIIVLISFSYMTCHPKSIQFFYFA